MTKDERFLLEAYKKKLSSKKDIIDPKEIARTLGLKEHLLNNILRGLMQANLVERRGPTNIILTTGGVELAKTLLPLD